MSGFSLEELLKSSAAQMRADLASRMVVHPGELGAARESIFRDFLRAYLPKRFEVATGFVFDCHGSLSKQIDIIIADTLKCPRFETAGDIRFYPVESVVAVGEVKSAVDSREKLYAAIENLESVKALDRSAGGKAFDTVHGEFLDHRSNHLHQVFSFVLVTGKCLSTESMPEILLNYILRQPAHIWTNVIFALDKFLATFCCDAGVCPNPLDARGVAIQSATVDDDLLMRFYLLLGGAIEVTRSSGLPYWEYLHHATKWSCNVYHSTTDDPPPFLSSITVGR